MRYASKEMLCYLWLYFSRIAKWMKTCGRKCVNTALIENIGIKKVKFLQNYFHVMT